MRTARFIPCCQACAATPHGRRTPDGLARRYEFGLFSPVFRTHGCRAGPSEADTGLPGCRPAQGSCGFNEIWSYGNDTQALLERLVRMRSALLLPYIRELDANVTARGVPTMRPLAYEFPGDSKCRGIDDQYMLGPRYLVAPVTTQNATKRQVYFPAGAEWVHVFHPDRAPIDGGQTVSVAAPLGEIPAFTRQ